MWIGMFNDDFNLLQKVNLSFYLYFSHSPNFTESLLEM